MDNIDIIFSEFNEEEMSEALKGVYVEADPELSNIIKTKLNIPLTQSESKKKKISLKIILPIAASLAVIVGAASVVMNTDLLSKINKTTVPTTVTTTSVTTTKAPTLEEGILSAIVLGDGTVLKSVIESSHEKAQMIMNHALQSLGIIPYSTVQSIAKTMYDAFGTTGLDTILESTILGDNQRALEELNKTDRLMNTPSEKSAFFFSAAFCSSEVLDAFIKKGYDITIKDSVGNTVYEIAKINSNQEIMEYLKGVN